MSKKKFTDGLESLFSVDTSKEVGQKGTAFLNPDKEKKGGSSATVVKKRRSSSRKTFTTDLDSLLEEALQESFEERMSQKEGSSKSKTTQEEHHQNLQRRPSSGLDMLIRRTIESGTVEADRKTGKKRLTVTFDKEKIQKLKKIARLEKAYLKDILGKLVEEYITDYESEKGNI